MVFRIDNGCFKYDDRPILNNINLELNNKDIIAILGSNGIGKTTLLKCMLNILKWDSGHSYLNGTDVKNIANKNIFNEVSYVAQAKTSAIACTVLEMVVMGRNSKIGNFSSPKKEDYRIARECLEQVGMLEYEDYLCTNISGGQLQMVLIARALANKPKIIVLDEPESNLDFRNQLIVLKTIKELAKKQDICIIFNTHYPNHALNIANKTLMLMKNGKNIFGNTKEIITKTNMSNAFDIKVHINKIELNNEEHYSIIATL